MSSVDVVVPVNNSKPVWNDCLESFYREIPINRLLIGDGGSIDDTIKIVKNYPRVTVYNQSNLKMLGYRLKQLIEKVETEWFIYLHSDVSLPEGWYDEMCSYRERWDWFECKRTAVYPNGTQQKLTQQYKACRAYSGSQMGRTEILKKAVKPFEDDYIFRTEDIIIMQNVLRLGGRYGKCPTTFHYHHITLRKLTVKEQIETYVLTAKAAIKYLWPSRWNIIYLFKVFRKISKLNVFCLDEWREYAEHVNPVWSKWLSWFRLWKLVRR